MTDNPFTNIVTAVEEFVRKHGTDQLQQAEIIHTIALCAASQFKINALTYRVGDIRARDHLERVIDKVDMERAERKFS